MQAPSLSQEFPDLGSLTLWGLGGKPIKPCTSRQGLGNTEPSGLYWGGGIS